jgi:hypothetical protein
MESLISVLIAIIGGLGFLLFHKNKQNIQLKADKDLTSQSKDSKIVDNKVKSAEEEIKDLEKTMDDPVEEAMEFWKKYNEKK